LTPWIEKVMKLYIFNPSSTFYFHELQIQVADCNQPLHEI